MHPLVYNLLQIHRYFEKIQDLKLWDYTTVGYGTSSFNGVAVLGGVAGNCPAGICPWTQACRKGTRALPNRI